MSVTGAEGFVAAGVSAGVKPSGSLDLALVATDDGVAVPAAGVFTRNRMTAAPVVVTRSHLRMSGGRLAAVVLNAGNANAANGDAGILDAEEMCAAVAAEMGCADVEVAVCSTGLIGIPLPMDAIRSGIPGVVSARSRSGATDAAEAIRTTDTRRKEVLVERPGFTVGGMAKGAAMLAPDMATMLAVLTTDASCEPDALAGVLRHGVADSFNALTVDGCTSTNDTVLLLASGRRGPVGVADLRDAVAEACASLAAQMAADAEGATKVVRITVTGAGDDREAATAARTVAESQLCKCSWYGCDPYWGRVACELGRAGVAFDPGLLSITYGGIEVCRCGVEVAHDRSAVADHMSGSTIELGADLGIGSGRAVVLTNDLTHAYVDENMGTS